jgi:hypothetical protein
MQMSDFFQFEKFLAPVMIKVVYWIGLALIVISVIAMISGVSLIGRTTGYGDASGSGGASFGAVLVSLLVGAILAFFWRVWCELCIVIFSINDRLGHLSRIATVYENPSLADRHGADIRSASPAV